MHLWTIYADFVIILVNVLPFSCHFILCSTEWPRLCFENQLLNQFVKATQKLKGIVLKQSIKKVSRYVSNLKGFLVDETTFPEEM